MLQHAGQLHDLAQLHLAPLPANARRAQRADQVLRFLLELLLCLTNGAQEGSEAGRIVDALPIGLGQGRRHLRQRFPDRRDQGIQGLLARAEVGGRGAVDVRDLLVGEFEELPGAGGQGAGGERFEGVAELLLHRLQEGELFGDDPFAVGQFGRETGMIGLQFRRAFDSPGPCQQPAHDPAEPQREQRNQHQRHRHYNLEAV